MSSTNEPGLRDQAATRTTLRLVGVVLLLVALPLLAIGVVDFMSSMGSFEGPHRFWMVMVGGLLLAPALWCLQAGFMGVASRYVAGETMPVVKDSAAYLTDGEGVLGIGRTVDDAPARASAPTGPYCSKCGTRNDADARFCDSCGAALAH